MKYIFYRIGALTLAILLCACVKVDEAPDYESSLMRVIAYDSAISNTGVKVYSINDDLSPSSNLLFEGNANEHGVMEFQADIPSQILLVEVGGKGSYVEEASGRKVDLKPSDKLLSLVEYQTGEDTEITVSGFTHIATAYAQCLVKQGAQPSSAIETSYAVFSDSFSFDISKTAPIDPTNITETPSGISEPSIYGIFAAAVSQKMKAIAEEQRVPIHRENYRSIDFYNYAFADVYEDVNCALDGFKQNSLNEQVQVGIGSFEFDANTYRSELASAVLEFLLSSENKSEIEASALVPQALKLSSVDHILFNGFPTESYDTSGPTIEHELESNMFFSGVYGFEFTASDVSGVDSVTLYIDDQLSSFAELQGDVYSSSIDTSQLSDGEYSLKLVALDSLGNTSEKIVPIQINNSGPVINLVSSKFVNQVTGEFTFLYSDAGQGLKEININGQLITELDENSQFTTSFIMQDGVNEIQAMVTDQSDVTNELLFDLVLDSESPSIEVTTPNEIYEVKYSNANDRENYSMVNLTFTPASLPLYYDDSLVKLNGIASIESNLKANGFPFIGFTVDDFKSGLTSGSYTERDRIKVYLDVQVGGEEKVFDRLLVEESEERPGFYALPLTEEYLGEHFFLVPDNVEILVKITAEDLAGNIETHEFAFKMRYFLELPVSTQKMIPYNGVGINSMPTLNDQRTAYTAEIVNDYDFPIEIKVEDFSDYEATLKYAQALRENLVGERTEKFISALCSARSVNLNAYDGYPQVQYDTFKGTHVVVSPQKVSPLNVSDFRYNLDRIGNGSVTDYYFEAELLKDGGQYQPLQSVRGKKIDLKRGSIDMPEPSLVELSISSDFVPSSTLSVTSHSYTEPSRTPLYGTNGDTIRLNDHWTVDINTGSIESLDSFSYLYSVILMDDFNNAICPLDSGAKTLTYQVEIEKTYQQVVGYPRNVEVTDSETKMLSSSIKYGINDSVLTAYEEAEFVLLNPGDTITLSFDTIFPKINYKSKTCMFDYTGNNYCNKGMDINLDLLTNVSFRPSLIVDEQERISNSSFDVNFGSQDYSF